MRARNQAVREWNDHPPQPVRYNNEVMHEPWKFILAGVGLFMVVMVILLAYCDPRAAPRVDAASVDAAATTEVFTEAVAKMEVSADEAKEAAERQAVIRSMVKAFHQFRADPKVQELAASPEFARKFADIAAQSATQRRYMPQLVAYGPASEQALAAAAKHIFDGRTYNDVVNHLKEVPDSLPTHMSRLQVSDLVDAVLQIKGSTIFIMRFVQEKDTLLTDRLAHDVANSGHLKSLCEAIYQVYTVLRELRSSTAAQKAEVVAFLREHVLLNGNNTTILPTIFGDTAAMEGLHGALSKEDLTAIVNSYLKLENYSNEFILNAVLDGRLLTLAKNHLISNGLTGSGHSSANETQGVTGQQ